MTEDELRDAADRDQLDLERLRPDEEAVRRRTRTLARSDYYAGQMAGEPYPSLIHPDYRKEDSGLA